MKIVADLQLHSKYSQAVSNKMTIEEIWFWSRVKGMDLVATADWTHPLWMREITEKLEETGRGTLRLKKDVAAASYAAEKTARWDRAATTTNNTEFLLATEISSIYSQGGTVRRVHNLIWTPTLASAHNIILELEKRGAKLGSDGRPIVGLSSRDLLEIMLSVDETALLIPAHAWTPWFALWGSKSGFDTIAECFEDLAEYVYAVETGLSSDPLMNWRIPELDARSIVSFSDAHSGIKVGREATVFELEALSYENIRRAIVRSEASSRMTNNHIVCTYEYYPEEGKYHWDGHRNCSIRQTPAETRERGTVCPVCGRGLTVGVEYRIDEVAQREPIIPVLQTDANGLVWKQHPQKDRPAFAHLIPLPEIISKVRGVGITSKTVMREYFHLITELGPEIDILTRVSVSDISSQTDERLSAAIFRVRSGRVTIDPGYDGVFGTVTVLEPDETAENSQDQIELF